MTGSTWRFVHPMGKMAPESKPRVPFSPEGIQNPWTPSQRAAIVLLLLGNIVIRLLKHKLSSSNINYDEYAKFHCSLKPWLFRTERWKSTNAGNDQGIVHRLTKLMLPAALCSLCTCVFDPRQVSRPIKLHNLLPRYNKHVCSIGMHQL